MQNDFPLTYSRLYKPSILFSQAHLQVGMRMRKKQSLPSQILPSNFTMSLEKSKKFVCTLVLEVLRESFGLRSAFLHRELKLCKLIPQQWQQNADQKFSVATSLNFTDILATYICFIVSMYPPVVRVTKQSHRILFFHLLMFSLLTATYALL